MVDPDELQNNLAGIREQSYALVHGEFEDEVDAVAAPVWGAGEQPIAPLTLGAPAFRFPANGTGAETAELVVETANQISRQVNQGLPKN